ncbi:MAG TPA: methyltransferase domain-containing protein [Propionibacteriaceae bacterium]|nr:methyltransferase domain-containing protein [Propionibacteriaceae bacterium]
MIELRRRRSVSQSHLLQLLMDQLDDLGAGEWRPLDIVDVGGGTGGVAIPLAVRGHRVTVVDPSPDALASLERRAAEAGVTGRIGALQGDAADLADLVPAQESDVVVCHRVLEVLEAPGEALRKMAGTLRRGGVLSLLVAQRHSLVLTQALAGHLALARRSYADPSRFDYDRVIELVEEAGFKVLTTHGIGAISDQVPERMIEAEAGAYAELVALESEISTDPAFRALAPHVHVFAQVRET